jgi:hypothetical protein
LSRLHFETWTSAHAHVWWRAAQERKSVDQR